VWEPRAEIPVGHGQTPRGWVVLACLGYSRAGAGALIFSAQTADLLFGIRRCLWRLGALPRTLVTSSCGPHLDQDRLTVTASRSRSRARADETLAAASVALSAPPGACCYDSKNGRGTAA
jgi:hypothetical protein